MTRVTPPPSEHRSRSYSIQSRYTSRYTRVVNKSLPDCIKSPILSLPFKDSSMLSASIGGWIGNLVRRLVSLQPAIVRDLLARPAP